MYGTAATGDDEEAGPSSNPYGKRTMPTVEFSSDSEDFDDY